MAIFGIDISTWQGGYPYEKATKNGVKFAIIRAGFSTTKDNYFEEHYKNAKAQGWGVGAYWYSYATSVEQAKKEANFFLETIKGKEFDYPIYLDIEDNTILNKTDKITRDNIVKAYGDIIEGAGYYFGVYTNVNWYNNYISGKTLSKKYDWWIAKWGGTRPNIDCGMWQFQVGNIAGWQTDQNYAYKDYPSIIKNNGLNGFTKPNTPIQPVNPTPTKTIEELAQEVLQGLWGNGEERYQRLTEAGYNYDLVQQEVNRILSEQNKTLKVGDKVQIIDYGNSQASGKGYTAYGIGYQMYILKIYKSSAFPYQVGNNTGTTGFYKANALKKI